MTMMTSIQEETCGQKFLMCQYQSCGAWKWLEDAIAEDEVKWRKYMEQVQVQVQKQVVQTVAFSVDKVVTGWKIALGKQLHVQMVVKV